MVSIPFKRDGVSELLSKSVNTDIVVRFLFPSNGTAFLNQAGNLGLVKAFKFLFPSNGTAFLNF